MSSERKIITELDIAELQKLQGSMGPQVLIIKFGADWCGPCKKIAPLYYQFINNSPDNILFADINVDENINLYMALKRYKMVQGIPVFLAFYGDVKRANWYIPDDSVIGADEKQVSEFFARCVQKTQTLGNSQNSYYRHQATD
jgi:thiol-disulfide isomerase/thioredoxin